MKSANWISATGRRPFMAAPIEVPMIIDSVSGVSMTRSSPNSPYSPSVARKTPPLSPTSSPSTITASSRRISSARVSRTASMNVLSAISPLPLRPSVDRAFGGGFVALVALQAVTATEAPWWRRLARPVLGEHPAHGRPRVGVGSALGVLRGGIDVRLHLGGKGGLDLVGEDARVLELLAEARQGVLRLELGQLLRRAVFGLLIVAGVGRESDDLGLDE